VTEPGDLIAERYRLTSRIGRGPLAPDYVATVGSQVASALLAAHAEGIVHRDVKPGNVLIAPDGVAKIADFGISRAVGDGTVTGSGFIAGTPAYLAPEVAAGGEAGNATDVFSLGATLYAAVEGHPPFGSGDNPDDNPIALLHRVAAGEITPPRQAGVLTDVLTWMLRRGPDERPTMAEAHGALTAVAEGQVPPPPRPRNPTLILPARRGPSRRVIIAGAAAAALLAAGVWIGVAVGGGSQPPAQAGSGAGPGSSTTPASAPCQAEFSVKGSWPDHYQGEVTIRADSGRLKGWTVAWALPAGHEIEQLWGGELNQDGSSVTVADAGWNGQLSSGQSATFGFNAKAPEFDQADFEAPILTCRSP
jgi:serine/threonine protein kinase